MNLRNLIKKGGALAVMTLFMTIMPVQAASNSNQGDIELQKGELIMGDTMLRDATAEERSMISSGKLVALAFDSLEEFEEYRDQRKAKTIDITNNIYELPSVKPFGLSDVSSRTIGVDPIPLPPVYINCQFTYTSAKNLSGQWAFTSISNIKSWLTGIQFPVNYSWTQNLGTYSFDYTARQ